MYESIRKICLDKVTGLDLVSQPLAFWIFDPNAVKRSYDLWKTKLPSVHPHYAIKCNPLPELVSLLGKLGCNFDCATITEVQEVLDLGFSPERCIFAQTFKPYNEIPAVRDLGVKLVTVDSLYEVEKMAKFAPDMDLVVRIRADDVTAGLSLGDKFGLLEEEIEPVIAKIKEHNLQMVGIAFHVGSDAHSASAFGDALHAARKTYAIAEKYDFHPTLVDIGGGFTQDARFDSFADVIESTIADLKFPTDVHFTAEPGRFFGATSMHLCVGIFGIRERGKHIEYICGDGITGDFACCITGYTKLEINELRELDGPLHESHFYGPSCNGKDKIGQGMYHRMTPGEDWLLVTNIGAYSMAKTTHFNGYLYKDFEMIIVDSDLDISIPEHMTDRRIPAIRGTTAPKLNF